MKFTELGLRAEILRAIAEQGYDTPTPIRPFPSCSKAAT